MTLRFETKIALITGAGSGMGRAITLRLAQEGAAVFAIDIDEADSRNWTLSAGGCVAAATPTSVPRPHMSPPSRPACRSRSVGTSLGNVAAFWPDI